MTAKQLATGTVVGAATLSATGYVMFWIALGNFYAYALNAGSATGVPRDSPLVWAVALGALSYGALLTLAIGNRQGAPAIGTGVKAGNVLNLTSTLIDPLLEIVPSAVAGGAIAAVLRKVR